MRAIILLFFLPIISTYALSVNIIWTPDFTKELHLECSNIGCLDGQSSDVIEEAICDECFSDSVNSTFIFNNITTYLHPNELITLDEFITYLYTADFISINYNSPYDLVSSRSMEIKKLLYKDLCPNKHDAIIFFKRGYADTFSSPELIYCGEEIYTAQLF
ncbi:hypothetical protein ABMA79_05425 [Halobacteriovorax sp. HFRX-2_2]|uniref:hypothetical protein n=1 Tax=unclassified Halobacteriovorax TaxID=2639665 RepID=UPI00371AF3DE